MRIGLVKTCMASKRGLVLRSRVWGRRGWNERRDFKSEKKRLVNCHVWSFRRRLFGVNLIDVPVKSYVRLLFEEVSRKISHICKHLFERVCTINVLGFLFVSLGPQPILCLSNVQHHPVDDWCVLFLCIMHTYNLHYLYQCLTIWNSKGESSDGYIILFNCSFSPGYYILIIQDLFSLYSKASLFETWPSWLQMSRYEDTQEVSVMEMFLNMIFFLSY